MSENPFYFEILKIFLAIWMSVRIYGGGPVPHSQGPKFLRLLTNVPLCLASSRAFYRVRIDWIYRCMPDRLIARYGMNMDARALCLCAWYHNAFLPETSSQPDSQIPTKFNKHLTHYNIAKVPYLKNFYMVLTTCYQIIKYG